jgi:hypothetical protein
MQVCDLEELLSHEVSNEVPNTFSQNE